MEVDLDDFRYNGEAIVILLDEENNPWFYGIQVAAILGYKRPYSAALDIIPPKYKKCLEHFQNNTMLTEEIYSDRIRTLYPGTVFINETGLIHFIIKTSNPAADQLLEWFLDTCRPSLRRYKDYKLKQQLDAETNQQNPVTKKHRCYIIICGDSDDSE